MLRIRLTSLYTPPLPTNLQLLDFVLYAQPLLPQANNGINLQTLDYVQFGSPFVANNIAQNIIGKVAAVSWVNVGKVSQVSKASTFRIARVYRP